ncbi:MAG TPA: glycosyltransferase family 4 protein [Candidatus Paceibacterota bacterium]|nr:glycosyltransferase family 4 protein [Candidatus Paceibacterota bacterium]
MPDPIDLFSMPRAKKDSAYYTLGPSMASAYPDRVAGHNVPYNNLLLLLLRRPWTSPRRVLCVHWSTVLYGSKYVLKSLAFLCMNTLALFLLKHLFGFKVVWVLHNNFGHDYPHPWIDRIGRAVITHFADALIAQQQATRREEAPNNPGKRVAYIPHSNYVGAFGPMAGDRAGLRTRFGFGPDDIVLLSLGAVKPYKRIERFIDALRELDPALSARLRLWIVGKGDAQYIAFLQERAKGLENVRIEAQYIPDEEVPAYAACADYGVFYFDESELTSASVLLSLSYGLPVISRSIAGTEMIRDGENGFVFENDEDLAAIIKRLPQLKRPDPEAVAATLDGSDWQNVERKYLELYESLTGGSDAIVSA